MSIRTRQLEVESQKLLRKELLEGNYPSLTAVNQKVAQKFMRRAAGLPRLELRPVSPRQISSAEDYNEMVESVAEDMDVSYQELMYQGDRMMALANYYDTEKSRIQLELKRLNQRTEILQEKLLNRGQRTVVFDTFNDYLSLEINGDKESNVEKTNAFVDLRYGYATLDRTNKGTAKIDLSGAYARVKPVTKFISTETLSAVDGALNDLINEGWRYKAVLDEVVTAEVTLTIELAALVKTNMISILPQSPRTTLVTLRTSIDGTTYFTEIEREVNALTEWNFEEREIKFIELVLRKLEPDIVNGTSYEYYFGAENISVRSVAFMPAANLVSIPHRIKRSFDNVTLQADDVIPPGTNIHYFMGIDKMDGSIVEWQPVRNKETVNMNAFVTEERSTNGNTPGYGALYGSRYNNNFYVIENFAHIPIPRSVKVLVGDGMFQLDTMGLTSELVPAPDAAFVATIDNWKRAYNYMSKYVRLSDLADGSVLTAIAGEMGRLTTYITMDTAKGFNMSPMSLVDTNVSVYVNNTRVQEIGGSFYINLRAGVNKLEILFYSASGGEIGVNLTTAILGAQSVYAQNNPLEQVSIYDLMNNTSKRTLSKFAVTGANQVVINYDPTAMDVKGSGVNYRFTYQYSNGLIDDDNYLRFMATLIRNDNNQDLTPVLRSYKLIIE